MVRALETQQPICCLPAITSEELLLLVLRTASNGKFTGWGSTVLDSPFPDSLSTRRHLCLERYQKDGLQGSCPGWDCHLKQKFHIRCRSIDTNIHLLLFYIIVEVVIYLKRDNLIK